MKIMSSMHEVKGKGCNHNMHNPIIESCREGLYTHVMIVACHPLPLPSSNAAPYFSGHHHCFCLHILYGVFICLISYSYLTQSSFHR